MSLNRFAKDRVYNIKEIDETVYIDIEDISWYSAVKKFVTWYDTEHGLICTTPKFCYEPAFNTWYPLKNEQKEEDILRFAGKCKELGIKTFEIDAGWFKSPATWELNTEKIPDLRKLVQKIKSMGLRVIIWYRPLDSGRSEELAQYRTKVEGELTDNLCPRNKDVHKRAVRFARELMTAYDLDGLKIDFLDASSAAAPLVNCEADHVHSYDFVSDGVREIMRMMADAVRQIKSDAIIEYRLNYSNIANRQFATIYRGQDAPSDPDHVRRHLALLRSWAVGVAPHADYAYWTPDVSDENVARFIASIVFYGVPTLSVDFDSLPESHFSIVKAWLAFYHEHKDRFWKGSFEILSNDFHYSMARISAPGHTYIPVFLNEWPSAIPVFADSSHSIYLFNGTYGPRILTRIEGIGGSYRASVLSRELKTTESGKTLTALNNHLDLEIPVPVGGMILLERM